MYGYGMTIEHLQMYVINNVEVEFEIQQKRNESKALFWHQYESCQHCYWSITSLRFLSNIRFYKTKTKKMHYYELGSLGYQIWNFVKIGPFSTNPVPNDRAHSGLLIGTQFVKNGSMLAKLCAKHIFNLVSMWSEFIVKE